jgi:uncharacterized protein YkwD
MKKRSPVFSFILIVIIGMAACAPKPPAKPAPAPKPVTISANVAPAIEDDILRQINAYRQSKKLPPMSAHPAIEYEARRHSMDMATKKVPFSHDGFATRMKMIQSKIPGVTAVSENVAYGSMNAKEVVDGWIKSTTHRRNIEGKFRLTGIGVARNEKNQLYFTQIFAN